MPWFVGATRELLTSARRQLRREKKTREEEAKKKCGEQNNRKTEYFEEREKTDVRLVNGGKRAESTILIRFFTIFGIKIYQHLEVETHTGYVFATVGLYLISPFMNPSTKVEVSDLQLKRGAF